MWLLDDGKRVSIEHFDLFRIKTKRKAGYPNYNVITYRLATGRFLLYSLNSVQSVFKSTKHKMSVVSVVNKNRRF